MYGNFFKELRQKRNLSIRQAANGIVAPSTLSRWENDEITPNFNIVISLLHRIRVSPQEFVNYAGVHYQDIQIDQINTAYLNKDIISLKNIYDECIQQYKENHSIHTLFICAIASNWYFELTKSQLLPAIYIQKISSALSSVTYWSQYYIGVLGNTSLIISDRLVFGLTNLIINDLNEIKRSGTDIQIAAWTAILNSFATFMKDNSPYAAKLYKKIKNITVSPLLVSVRFRKKYLEAIYDYQIKQAGEEKIYQMIEATKALGLEEYYSDFHSFFIEIQTKLNH